MALFAFLTAGLLGLSATPAWTSLMVAALVIALPRLLSVGLATSAVSIQRGHRTTLTGVTALLTGPASGRARRPARGELVALDVEDMREADGRGRLVLRTSKTGPG